MLGSLPLRGWKGKDEEKWLEVVHVQKYYWVNKA